MRSKANPPMLTLFTCENGRLVRNAGPSSPEVVARAAWIDLQDATEEEARVVTAATGLQVARRAELEEIETSSRLSTEDGAVYLSTPFLTHVTEGAPRTSP